MTLTSRFDVLKILVPFLATGLATACGGDDRGGNNQLIGEPDARAETGDRDAGGGEPEPDAGGDEPRVVLTNSADGCGVQLPVGPLPEELSHLVAARLTPEFYPFTVTGVRYQIESNADCRTDLAHRVELYVQSKALPAATPVVDASFEIPAADSSPALRVIDQALEAPLILEAGEHLVVAVELPGDQETGLVHCISMCGDTNSRTNRNLWSNAAAAPYFWLQLSDFGIPENTVIEAYGRPGP